MSDFQIVLDESTDMVFDLDIQGASTKNLKTRLMIETPDGFTLSFDGKMDESTSSTTFHIPILAQTLVPDNYKCSVEAIIEDGHYVKMADATLEARLPVKIKASYANNQLKAETDFSDVTASVEFKEPEAPVVEEKQDDTEASTTEIDTEKLLMQKSIEQWDHEVKSAGGSGFEVKDLKMSMTLDESADGTFEGYGSVFNNVDQAGDVIKNGSFKRTLNNNQKIKMLWQHDSTQPIGVYTEAYEDANGLFLKGEINLETQKGREAYSLLKQGAVDGLSIGYQVAKSKKRDRAGVRELNELKLHEVSIVTFPCNEEATVVSVKNDSTINNSITAVGDNSVEHSDEDSGATHSSNDPSNHLNSDVGTDTKALSESLEQLLTKFKGK